MRRLLALTVFFAILSTVRPAAAAPIDPFIGVRGVDAGSADSDSSAFFAMTDPCGTDLVSAFGEVYCFEYKIVQNFTSIFSIMLQFQDNSGLLPNTVLEGDPSGFNGFDSWELVGTNAIRLFFDGSGFLLCPVEGDDDVACGQGSTIQVFLRANPEIPEELNPPYFVSLLAINDVAIPEPGTLALLGLGIVAVAGRRLRRRPS